MFLKRSFTLVSFVLLLVLMLAAGQMSPSFAARQFRVLLISSYHPGFPTFFEQVNGIKSVFDGQTIELDIEFMDSKRFFDETNLSNFHSSLTYKLSQVAPYDVVMVADDNALNFVLDHQPALFQQTPVVFFGVNNVALALAQNNTPNVTGVIERVSMRDTIDLMLRLPPHPTKIYAIVDNTSSGQGDIEVFRKVTAEYSNVSFMELSLVDYSFAELANELAKIDGDSAVLLLSAYGDKLGEKLDFKDSLRLIRNNLKVPLYHLWYHGMGDGVLGGKLISHFEQGRTAAKIVLQILAGTPVQTISVTADSPNRFMFDYREMARFGITEADLPENSEIINRPVSFYQSHQTVIWIVIAVFSCLLALIILLSINILRRRQTEQKLRESEQKYRTYIDSAPYGVLVTNDTGQTIEVNNTATRITGISKNTLLQLSMDELIETSQHNGIRQLRPASDSHPMSTELKLARPDGSECYVAIDAVKLPDNQILAYCNDITDRKQAEDELRRRNRQLNVINRVITASAAEVETTALLATMCRELAFAFDVPQAAAALIEQNGSVARVVAEYRSDDRPSGINHLIPVTGNPAFDYLVKTNQPLIVANAKTDTRLVLVRQIVQEREIASILLLPLIVNGEVVGSLGVDSLEPDYFSQKDFELASSVTNQVSGALARAMLMEERQKLEQRNHHAQRMESLGRLTGGVAHDFNNLLTAINGFAELIQFQLSPDHPVQPMLQNILNSGMRAADLVRQLLAFSRKQIIEPQTLDLNTIIINLEKILQRIIGENISLKTNLAPDIWPVRLDPTQIEQVIVNMVVNGRDAMPEGGTLAIKTSNQTLAENQTPVESELPPGDYVVLSVLDTGLGMTAEILAHIFEPFFTTKEPGRGTGLGLTTVYGIVKQNGGDVLANSSPENGAHFTIYLPRAATKNGEEAPTDYSGSTVPPGHETVLVVEDDSLVRSFICKVLKLHGYNLLEAPSAEAALRIARQTSEKIDLLLTDVIMPGMNGKQLSDQFTQIRPGTAVLFASGYTDDYIIHHGVLEPGFHFIQKPLSPSRLVRKVREVLDTAAKKSTANRLPNVE